MQFVNQNGDPICEEFVDVTSCNESTLRQVVEALLSTLSLYAMKTNASGSFQVEIKSHKD